MPKTLLRVLGLEPRTHGLKGRCGNDITNDDATTYKPTENQLHQKRHQDPALLAIVEAWPMLPDAIRVAVVALVRMSTPQDRMDTTDAIQTDTERESR